MTKANPFKTLGAIVGIILSIIIIFIGYFVVTHFCVHQTRVDGLLSSLPREEAFPAPVVKDVIRRVDQQGLRIWVPRHLAAEFRPGPMRALEWRAHDFVWSLLLPLRLSEDQRISLYCHFMRFGEGKGLNYGARYYYSKTSDNLSVDEVLWLIAVSRAPSRHLPNLNSEHFRKEVEKLRNKYRAD